MSKKVKIDRIRITVGEKTIDLTPDELKELREVLDAIFGEKTVYLPGQPIVIERPISPPWPMPRPWPTPNSWPRPWPYKRWKGATWESTHPRKEYQTLCLSNTG